MSHQETARSANISNNYGRSALCMHLFSAVVVDSLRHPAVEPPAIDQPRGLKRGHWRRLGRRDPPPEPRANQPSEPEATIRPVASTSKHLRSAGT
jgi:hypothetical protein